METGKAIAFTIKLCADVFSIAVTFTSFWSQMAFFAQKEFIETLARR